MDDVMSLLIVDDDEALASLTSHHLQQREHIETVVETNARDGLAHVGDVDCVISDYNMPAMDGLAFLTAVRERSPDLPFILFTGRGSEEIASQAISAGVTDYLQKGVGSEQYEVLANRATNAAEKYRAERTLAATKERYGRLVEQNLAGIYIIQDGYFQYGNPQMAEMLGYSQQELASGEVNQATLVAESDLERVTANLERRERGEVDNLQFRFSLRRPTGEVVDVEVHGGRIEYEGEPAVMGTMVEVADRQHADDGRDGATHSERLEQLHEATRRLMAAETTEAVLDIATETARTVLGLELNAVCQPTGNGTLVPTAITAEAKAVVGSLPELPLDDSIAGEVFETGEPRVHRDVREDPAVSNPETAMRSELHLPLGDHGVFLVGSTVVDDFSESDVSLARVLASNVETALNRADREETLRRREAELRRQNERLDQFASVVSHDLQTPLTVAQGRLDLLCERTDVDTDHEDVAAIERAHERIASLTDRLLSLARQGQAVGETSTVDLDTVVRTVWDGLDGGSLTVTDSLGQVEADPDRLYELVANLCRNAVEHAGDDVSIRVGPLASQHGFFVDDDGPGIDRADRADVFDYGFTTDETGTGFGLAIVKGIAEAHGWQVSVTESESGGARFEVEIGENE